MSLMAVTGDRDPPAASAEPAGHAHQAALERAFGRIFAVFVAATPAAKPGY
jgi:hypothetical protein